MKQRDYMKCRFCNWETVKRYTNKKGEFCGIEKAYSRLFAHIKRCHEQEDREFVADIIRWVESHPLANLSNEKRGGTGGRE